MAKPLTCDEITEIRTIMKHIHQIIVEAEENDECGHGNELSDLVLRYLPMVEQSYKNFVERSAKE